MELGRDCDMSWSDLDTIAIDLKRLGIRIRDMNKRLIGMVPPSHMNTD